MELLHDLCETIGSVGPFGWKLNLRVTGLPEMMIEFAQYTVYVHTEDDFFQVHFSRTVLQKENECHPQNCI